MVDEHLSFVVVHLVAESTGGNSFEFALDSLPALIQIAAENLFRAADRALDSRNTRASLNILCQCAGGYNLRICTADKHSAHRDNKEPAADANLRSGQSYAVILPHRILHIIKNPALLITDFCDRLADCGKTRVAVLADLLNHTMVFLAGEGKGTGLQRLFRALLYALHAQNTFRPVLPLPGVIRNLHIHRADSLASAAGDALCRITADAKQREVAHRL